MRASSEIVEMVEIVEMAEIVESSTESVDLDERCEDRDFKLTHSVCLLAAGAVRSIVLLRS